MINPNDFKEAVGKFPTGVTVISTIYDGELYGFTANSFASVSLHPPLISFCLNKCSKSFNAFLHTTNFAISILANNQSDIAQHFAKSIDDKFKLIKYKIGDKSHCPLIMDAVCWIECSKYKSLECGDHYIFIGEVNASKINNDNPSLLYFAKTYKEAK